MNVFDNLQVIAISIFLTAGLGSCHTPGPAEAAGRSIGRTLDDTGQTIGAAADQAAEAMSRINEKVIPAISDAEITTRINAAIVAEPAFETLLVIVDTKDGVVTLTGSVDSMKHSDMADATAKKVSGVREVNNWIQIRFDQPRTLAIE